MGRRPRRGLSRYLCDRHRMVANQSKLAVGGLHRPAMALFAAPAAAFARVTLAADRDPAARDRPSAVAPPACGRMTDFDHNAIDEVLQSRVRIAIVAFLASAGNVDFAGVRDA